MIISNIDLQKIAETQDKVEEHSEVINNLVEDTINPYCKDLDKYIAFIRNCLKD